MRRTLAALALTGAGRVPWVVKSLLQAQWEIVRARHGLTRLCPVGPQSRLNHRPLIVFAALAYGSYWQRREGSTQPELGNRDN